jgi:DNA polymerase (family 10)
VGSSGPAGARVITHTGLPVDLRIVPEEAFGNLLQHFTGSGRHNEALRTAAVKQGLHVSEYGIADDESGGSSAYRTEEEVYERLGMEWVPPELREDRGELAAARAGKLPRLIELVRGLNDKIDGIEILVGTETNILPDGMPDYDDDLLEELDWVVGSVHTSFGMSSADMTKRIVSAIEHPWIDCIGHLTGRKLGRRGAAEVDFGAIVVKALETGTLLEINSQPNRLDLSDVHARAAREAGLKLVVSTDAHQVESLEFARDGLGQARRAGCTADDVANTRGWAELDALRKRR